MRLLDPLDLGGRDHVGTCRELNLFPLRQQTVLFTTKFFLQPPQVCFAGLLSFCMFLCFRGLHKKHWKEQDYGMASILSMV